MTDIGKISSFERELIICAVLCARYKLFKGHVLTRAIFSVEVIISRRAGNTVLTFRLDLEAM